jgi:transposase InsO family protein
LRRWEKAWHRNRLAVQVRGRPIEPAEAELRAAVYATLQELGPGSGVPTLHRLFPEVGKRELEELVRRYRHAHRRERRILLYALRWRRPGSVWAMDFTEPPKPVEGLYDQIFCVRDLPSGYQLWALPTIGKHTRTVIQALEALVKWHGAPLVLKLDNDGVFRSDALRAWARERGVLLLYSPARRPSYNGAAENGIGGLKIRAHYISALNDRVGNWTCDDLEQARRQMNRLGRPRGADGACPDELWNDRESVRDEERDVFLRDYRRRYGVESAKRGIPWGVQLQHIERTSIDREAIARVLVEHGFLMIRRRRITLSIRRWNADKISS